MNIIQKWTKFVRQTLSLRLSFMVVSAIAALLIGTLVVMFHFTRLVLKDEAMRDAENTLEEPMKIVPKTSELTVTAPQQNITVPARTFYIYKIKK